MIPKRLLLTTLLLMAVTGLTAQKPELVNGLYFKNGMLYTGTYKEYHPNGQLLIEQNIRNGLEHGNTDLWFATGFRQEHREFDEGRKNGTWIKWNEAGIAIAEASYRDNLKEGTWLIRSDNGRLLYEMHYSGGNKAGIWKQWDDSGKLIMEKSYGRLE